MVRIEEEETYKWTKVGLKVERLGEIAGKYATYKWTKVGLKAILVGKPEDSRGFL